MKLHNSIVLKYYITIVSVLLLFTCMGIVGYQYLIRNIFPQQKITAPLFIAKMVDIFGADNKINGIKKYLELKEGMQGPDLELIDATGQDIYPINKTPGKATQRDLQKLVKPYDFTQLDNRHFLNPHTHVFLVKLSGQPVSYLKIIPTNYARDRLKANVFFIFSFVTLMMTLLLGSATAIWFIYRSLKRLLDKASHSDNVRINLLQELTHDLKTPISSLKMLLETLENKEADLKAEVKKELLGLARKEVDYFSNLIDDLLLLAKMSEPHYPVKQEIIDLSLLLSENICDIDPSVPGLKNKKIIKKFSDESQFINGDKHLLRRAFRNALQNAIYYANHEVTIDIERLDQDKLRVVFQDDGPGFSDNTLHTFGEKLVSRKFTEKSGTKVSLGLGSVIIKTICELHSARYFLSNTMNLNNVILGAKLEIEFEPVFHHV